MKRATMPERPVKNLKSCFTRFKRKAFEAFETFSNTRSFSWIALVALAVIITSLITLSPQKIPGDLSEGSIAARNIKADRNYEIIDEEVTNALRKEAIQGVLSVYDFDRGLANSIAEKIHEAFKVARQRYDELIAQKAGGLKSKAIALTDDEQSEVIKIFAEKLGVHLSPPQQKALFRERMGERLETLLADLVRRALQGPVVMDRATLDSEKGKGIVLRSIKEKGGDKAVATYEDKVVEDTTSVLSLDEAKRRIAEMPLPSLGFRSENSPAAADELAILLVQPNCALNMQESQRRKDEAAANVANVVLKIKSGEMIIREGSRFEPRHIKVLKGIQKEKRRGVYAFGLIGTFVLVLMFLITPFYLAERFFRRVRPTRTDHYLMAFVGLSIIFIMRLSLLLAPGIHDAMLIDIATSSLYYAIPVAGGAMLLRMFLGAEITLVFAVVMSVVAGLFVGTGIQFISFSLASNFTAVISITKVDRRSQIIKAGCITGLVGALAVLCIKMIVMASATESLSFQQTAWTMLFAFLGGLGSAIYTTIAAPVVESISGYTSDIKLLELANLNHPLLRELIVRAPGTYHHSHMVGILGEAAAEAIGANALLVRVGAYYHDIGKMRKPAYFIENMKGAENKHEKLSPHMSALIVSAHVKEGMEMAQAAGIPKVISNMIPEHHGTRMIGYFYDKAKSQEDPLLQKVDPKDFRYPGPKPQTRESAILMLADVTEASVRSLKEKSTVRISQTVQRTINDIFAEAQLDECDLTLRDLNDIARAFTRIFLGIYHQRIEYPKESENGKKEISVVDESSTRDDRDDEPPRAGGSG